MSAPVIQVNIQHKAGFRDWYFLKLVDLLEYENVFAPSTELVNPDTWQSCKKSLLDVNPGVTHILVLQDDIIPCKDFIEGVKRAIRIFPEQIISYHSPLPQVSQAVNQGGSWAKTSKWFHAQAYSMPVNKAKEAVKWIEENTIYNPADDQRLATYIFYTHQYVYLTAPCLVEHLDWDYTLTGAPPDYYKKEERTASRFIGITKSANEIDFSLGLENIPTYEGKNAMFCDYLTREYYRSL